MVKFAHMADVHLGGWKIGPMRELNYKSFEKAIDISIEREVEFVLISGDFFNHAMPTWKDILVAVEQLKKLKDKNIKVYFIKGSHDTLASGNKDCCDFIETLELGINVYKEATIEMKARKEIKKIMENTKPMKTGLITPQNMRDKPFIFVR